MVQTSLWKKSKNIARTQVEDDFKETVFTRHNRAVVHKNLQQPREHGHTHTNQARQKPTLWEGIYAQNSTSRWGTIGIW